VKKNRTVPIFPLKLGSVIPVFQFLPSLPLQIRETGITDPLLYGPLFSENGILPRMMVFSIWWIVHRSFRGEAK
jgi:hypothetical protein